MMAISSSGPVRNPFRAVRRAKLRREKRTRKPPAAPSPPLRQATIAPSPANSSMRKYQIEIGDLQNRHLPLSQSQLKIGMLSRASTWRRQDGQKERRGWLTVSPIGIR